jgi:hypothetical protein
MIKATHALSATRSAPSTQRIAAQIVGAIGEKAVEVELLRRGWITANVNTSIKNVADYDLFAHKGERAVSIRVKACHFTLRAFQFHFGLGKTIVQHDLANNDFSIMMVVGDVRQNDEFYIMPTRILREQINEHRDYYLNQPKRGGGPHKDGGHWALSLDDAKSDPDRHNHGYAKKWKVYHDGWEGLDHGSVSAADVTPQAHPPARPRHLTRDRRA